MGEEHTWCVYEILNVRNFNYPVLHGLHENFHLRKFPAVRYVIVHAQTNDGVDIVYCSHRSAGQLMMNRKPFSSTIYSNKNYGKQFPGV